MIDGSIYGLSKGFPASGKVNAFAQNPKDAKILYVAGGRGTGQETYSSAGIYRSTDGGTSWEPIVNGLTDRAGYISSTVNALWLDPARPNVLLAATENDGIFRSSDAGSTWSVAYASPHATDFAVFGGVLYATSVAGILSSTDDGADWTISLAGSALRHPTALGVVSTPRDGAFYAGMSDGSIFAFARGRWSQVGIIPYKFQPGGGGNTPVVHQIAVDPFSPATVYASSNDGYWDQDLHASTDGGHTWNTVLKKTYVEDGLGTQAIAFSRVHPHRLYIGTDGELYYVQGDGSAAPAVHPAATLSAYDVRNIWASANGSDDACWLATDQGLDYEPTCSQGAHNDAIASAPMAVGLARRFSVSPNGRTVIVSLQDFAAHATSDGGASWSRVPNLDEDGFNAIQPRDPKICYVLDETGFRVSHDGCRTFRYPSVMAQHLIDLRTMTVPLAIDPSDPRSIYLTALLKQGSNFSFGLFRTRDDGKTFVKLNGPYVYPGSVAIDAHDGRHMIVANYPGTAAAFFVTFDGGKTWVRSKGVAKSLFWYSSTISPVDGRTILASTVDRENAVCVFRSSDGGRSFRRLANVTRVPLQQQASTRERDETVADLSLPDEVYSPAREIRFNQDVVRGVPDAVLTTQQGAFLSSDLGTTWQRIDRGTIAHSFWGIGWYGGYLYLGSDGQGVLRSTAAVQTP
jgi:photosystem II stability/assembly factor-like uncharacterized protein